LSASICPRGLVKGGPKDSPVGSARSGNGRLLARCEDAAYDEGGAREGISMASCHEGFGSIRESRCWTEYGVLSRDDLAGSCVFFCSSSCFAPGLGRNTYTMAITRAGL
jgi:hypothetical protein